MVAVSLLALALSGAPPAPPEPPATLMRQADDHARVAILARPDRPHTKEKDHRWDGALAGALAGAGAGALTALLTYGSGNGEWPEMRVYMGGMTFYGAVLGATTGLIVDLVRK